MSAMGIGAWLSRHVDDPEPAFIRAQIALGVIGGGSALVLFWAYVLVDNYNAFLFIICITAGALVGLEIPLVTRILEREADLRINISNILTADYIGALAAALLFPLILVPQLGLIQTGLLLGSLNLAVAGMAIWLFRQYKLAPVCAGSFAAICAAMLYSAQLTQWIETRLFDAEIIYAETTPFQRLVVTKSGTRQQLFIDGGLQFDTIDEYRYHEALVHPLMTLSPRLDHILILGGGDGMVVREVLKYPGVERITLVDLDPAMTRLFRDQLELAALNGQSLQNPKVEIVNADAWQFAENDARLFDAVIIDLPDPKNLSLSKLYSVEFYQLLTKRLSRDALIVTQATSPVFARQAFWSINATLAATTAPFSQDEFLETRPYHAYVPSFGDWGFVLAGSRIANQTFRSLPNTLRFIDDRFFATAQRFPDDMGPVNTTVNSILEHSLAAYYEDGWASWFK